MASVTVSHVPNSVSGAKLQEFFAFCGQIQSVEPLGADGAGFSSYRVSFTLEKALATALLLNEAELDHAEISVTEDALPPYSAAAKNSAVAEKEYSDHKVQSDTVTGDAQYDDVPQEDKPKLAIFAQILASGYHLSDKVIAEAVAIDQRNGISNRFKNFLTDLDSKYFHTDDPQSSSAQGLEKAQKQLNSLSARFQSRKYQDTLQGYFERATASPCGAKVHHFYKQVAKEVVDVHEEAKRLYQMRLESERAGNRAEEGQAVLESGQAVVESGQAAQSEKTALQ